MKISKISPIPGEFMNCLPAQNILRVRFIVSMRTLNGGLGTTTPFLLVHRIIVSEINLLVSAWLVCFLVRCYCGVSTP